jgi:hypothetical protein
MYMFNIPVQDITVILGKVVTNDVAEIQVIWVPAFKVGVLVAEGGTACEKEVRPSNAAASSRTRQHDL